MSCLQPQSDSTAVEVDISPEKICKLDDWHLGVFHLIAYVEVALRIPAALPLQWALPHDARLESSQRWSLNCTPGSWERKGRKAENGCYVQGTAAAEHAGFSCRIWPCYTHRAFFQHAGLMLWPLLNSFHHAVVQTYTFYSQQLIILSPTRYYWNWSELRRN